MVMMIRLPSSTTRHLRSMSIPFQCGISLKETMNGGPDYLDGGTDLRAESTPFGRALQVMELDPTFIIVSEREPIGMKVSLIIIFHNGRNGITLSSQILV